VAVDVNDVYESTITPPALSATRKARLASAANIAALIRLGPTVVNELSAYNAFFELRTSAFRAEIKRANFGGIVFFMERGAVVAVNAIRRQQVRMLGPNGLLSKCNHFFNLL